MKIIITEGQSSTVKKIKVMEKYIDDILSDYDWYEGIDKVSVEDYRLSRYSKKTIPLYVFYIITNDDESAYRDSTRNWDGSVHLNDEIDEMFGSLFPYDNTNQPSAVWVFRFVRSENYGK